MTATRGESDLYIERPHPQKPLHFAYGDGSRIKQVKAVIGGNDTAWARSQVSYYSAWCGPSTSPAVGVVDMQKYGDWLAGQGVAMKYLSASANQPCE